MFKAKQVESTGVEKREWLIETYFMIDFMYDDENNCRSY